jgi:hypothetical protein
MILGYPVESIERVLNTIQSNYRTHEAVAEAIAAIRLKIDRITILVPGTPQPFDGDSTGSMLGGSEEAVVYLSRALAKSGRNVRVYGVLPPLTIPGVDRDGVDYQPFGAFKLEDEHGTVVIWRSIPLLHQLLSHKSHVTKAAREGDKTVIEPSGIGRASLWLHDSSLGIEDPAVGGALLGAVNSVIVLSDFHRRRVEETLPKDHKAQFVKLSNGVVREQYDEGRKVQPPRDPNRIVYSSCPSRGLRYLMRMWPTIKAACPDAFLDIYYDWGGLRLHQPEIFQSVMEQYAAITHLDVKHHGGVGHDELNKALFNANVWAYSHYESDGLETFAISAVKATAAGATVVISPSGALPEVAPESIFIANPDDYAAEIIRQIKNPQSEEDRLAKANRILDRYDWDVVAKGFSEEWTVRR